MLHNITITRLEEFKVFQKKVLVIGGTGKMGSWFAKFFRNKGFKVTISGRTLEKTRNVAKKLGVKYAWPYIKAVKNVSMVIVSVPIEVTPQIVLETAPHLKKGTVLFDLASVKHEVLPSLKKAQAYGVYTLSLHPMFGPGAKTVKGKNILVIPVTRKTEVLNFVLKPFLMEGAKIVFVKDAEVHDKMVALTLALPHFLNMVFGKGLASININPNRLKNFGGTTFKLQLTLTESVFQEDPKLYIPIQTNNKYFPKILKEFTKEFKELRNIVLKGEKGKFTNFFSKTKEFLAKDKEFKEAYKKFYTLEEKV